MWPFPKAEKAAPERSASDAPVQPNIVYMSSGIGVAIVKWNDYIAVETGMRHPIVRRALNKIAESVQQVSWFAEVDPHASASDQRGKASVIRDIQGVLDSPNEQMTASMLRYWMALNYAGYGRVPLKIGMSAIGNKVNGIYPLEARMVLAKHNARGIVDRYEYGLGQASQQYPSRATAAPGANYVEQIWKPGLKGYQAADDVNTPMQSVGLPAQVIRSLLLRTIQTAEGHPNVRYMVTCSRTLTDPQKEALKAYINQDHGPDGPDAGRVPILQNAGDIQIHKLDNDLSDIHSKMPSDDMARLIFGAFGVPIALAGMGAADGAKFAGNYVESRLSFWQDTIIPGYVEPLLQGLSRLICPPGVRISGDLDSIPALMQGRITSMSALNGVDFLTINEKRELFGWGSMTTEAEN